MKRNYVYIGIVAIVVIGGVIFLMNQGDKINNIADEPTASSTPVQSMTPTQTPKLIKSTPKPSSELIAREGDNYQYWVDRLDPLNRRLIVDENCMSIAPSQVSYLNNTQIMLDNLTSSQAHILKIGTKEYSLNANSWQLVTLNSSELPAQLIIFCGSMELGQIDLK